VSPAPAPWPSAAPSATEATGPLMPESTSLPDWSPVVVAADKALPGAAVAGIQTVESGAGVTDAPRRPGLCAPAQPQQLAAVVEEAAGDAVARAAAVARADTTARDGQAVRKAEAGGRARRGGGTN
jgi:hypothetical protein